MSQSVKIYGLIFLACVCLLLFLDFDRKLIMEDSLFESVRTTQLSVMDLSLIHISEPTRQAEISYAVFCLKKKKKKKKKK